jgi:hypothetical protein
MEKKHDTIAKKKKTLKGKKKTEKLNKNKNNKLYKIKRKTCFKKNSIKKIHLNLYIKKKPHNLTIPFF